MYSLVIDLFIFNRHKPKSIYNRAREVRWMVLKVEGCVLSGFRVQGENRLSQKLRKIVWTFFFSKSRNKKELTSRANG